MKSSSSVYGRVPRTRTKVIGRRLREAAEEIKDYLDYDYVLVNRDVELSAGELAAIIQGRAPAPSTRMEGEIKPILNSFERAGNIK